MKNNSDINIERQLIKKDVYCYLSACTIKQEQVDFLIEEPLSINIQGKTYSTIMRTPGGERDHAAGFCFAEGIVDNLNDIQDISLCDGEDSNVAAVMLSKERVDKIAHILEKKGYVSQTSCGICGREIIDDLSLILKPVENSISISFEQIINMAEKMDSVQHLRPKCYSSHASVILNSGCEIISSAEDAGRHNALDKSIGKLFLQDRLKDAKIAVISSRASYEMIQKCARAGIEIVISMSMPTALAYELGKKMRMTLAHLRSKGIFVYTGKNRIKLQE